MNESQFNDIKALTESASKTELWHAVIILRDAHKSLLERQARINPLIYAIEEMIDRRMVGDNN